jgi:hypothetical protein
MSPIHKLTAVKDRFEVLTVGDPIRADLAAGDAGYRAAGEKFIAQKAALKHGEWGPWLKAEGFTERTAQYYMAYSKSAPECGFAEWRDEQEPNRKQLSPAAVPTAPGPPDLQHVHDDEVEPEGTPTKPARGKKTTESLLDNGLNCSGNPRDPVEDAAARLLLKVSPDVEADLKVVLAGAIEEVNFLLGRAAKLPGILTPENAADLKALHGRLGALLQAEVPRWSATGASKLKGEAAS